MKLIKISERHFKTYKFHGNQYVNIDIDSKKRVLKVRKNSNIKGCLVLTIFILTTIYSVGIRFINRPIEILSPLASNQVYAEATQSGILSFHYRVVMPTPTISFKDARAKKLYEFLIEKDSPFADKSEYIVELADKYAIDYTLITAISGKESDFGKNIKPNSYNAWGIMGWDLKGKRFIRSFRSWNEAIEYVSRLLGENYKLNSIRGIGEKYCPAYECSKTWAIDVSQFSQEIIDKEV